MNLGTLGVDALLDSMAGKDLANFARKIEKLGYSALWFPEAFGRDPFALAAHLLTVTEKLVVGTAIANVWKREPIAMLSAARTLAEMFPERFVLGIGAIELQLRHCLGRQILAQRIELRLQVAPATKRVEYLVSGRFAGGRRNWQCFGSSNGSHKL